MRKKPPSGIGVMTIAAAAMSALYFGGLVVAKGAGSLTHGSLFDILYLALIPVAAVAVFKRKDLGSIPAAALLLFWWIDAYFYWQAVPLCRNTLLQFLWWAQGHGGFWWFLSFLLIAVSLGLFVVSAAKRRVLSMIWTGMAALLLLGVKPAVLERNQFSLCLRPLAVPEEVIGRLIDDRSGQVLSVRAFKDENTACPVVRVLPGQTVVVRFECEPDNFYFRNARDFTEARRDPHFVRGTFQDPCRMLAGYTTDAPGRYALDPRIKPYPISTNAIHLRGHAFEPLTEQLSAFVALRAGEVSVAYNFPRGGASYSNDNAAGERLYRIWVFDREEVQRAAS